MGLYMDTLKEKNDLKGLLKALEYRDLDIRNKAAIALGEMGDERAVEPLVATLNDENIHVRNNAAKALEKIGKPSVKTLLKALKSDKKSIRSTAAKTLGNIGDIRALEPLKDLLKDKEAVVRNNAAIALEEMGYERKVEPSQKLISRFPRLYILLHSNNIGIKNAIINMKGYKAIQEKQLFDKYYYLKRNADVRLSGTDPLIHYLYHGYKEGRNPSKKFDGNEYLKRHPDVKNLSLNPLVHYSLYGIYEERTVEKAHDPIQDPNNIRSLSNKDIKKKFNEIISKNSELIKLHPFDADAPLVSIIVLNRNGLEHLKRLFKNFKENIQYPSFEIIVVDNASSDDSITFLEKLSLPIKIIKNTENESFSKANNQAVIIAKGDFILLLNNDIETTFGWLNEMMQTALKSHNTGAVGAKLVYPNCSDSLHNRNNSFNIQHAGIAFKDENGFIKPYNIGKTEPFKSDYNSEGLRAAVTAAALLVRKDRYWEVDGLDEEFNYGYEDVDFCLKLLKKGYDNIYSPKALLFHYEFGTQENDKNIQIRNRRQKNKELFIQKWNRWLSKQLFLDKLNNKRIYSENPLKIGFVIKDTDTNTSNDYITALDLSKSLQKLGWNTIFLPRNGSVDFYEVDEDVEVLISLIDSYDPNRINCPNRSLIKIAWTFNRFDKWISNPGISDYDIILTSSETSAEYFTNETGIKPLILPKASNIYRFNDQISIRKEYMSDISFTESSKINSIEFMNRIDAKGISYTFYNKLWENFDKFNNYSHGFPSYSNLPEVYASTKIVIDEVNSDSKKFGIVNNRVYDATLCGALVITSGSIAADEIFNGNLPVFKSQDDMIGLIEYYLANEDEMNKKINVLQEIILKDHTYKNSAKTLKEILENYYIFKIKITIKIAASKWKNVQEWGDYHLALGLKREFEKNDYKVVIQILPEWNNDEDADSDVVIVLRGLNKYDPKKQHLNIMWNISHPDDIMIEEYNQYDHVFIASELWAQKIGKEADVPVESMLQCTDPKLFYPDIDEKYKYELLFVGNSRNVFRKILNDLLPTDKDLAVYGTNWERLIPKKYIKGKYIPNNELRRAYSSSKILLNDHWDDMREKSFISNRIFDGFASGAFIISDNINGAENVFDDSLVTYDHPNKLKNLIDTYLNNDDERMRKIRKGRDIVIENHTFQNRVEQILEIIDKKLKRI